MSLSAPVAQPAYADTADLDAYPIHDLHSEQGQTPIARCRQQLTRTGVCNLPGFIRPEAVARMIQIAGELADTVRHNATRRTDIDPLTSGSAHSGLDDQSGPAMALNCGNRLYAGGLWTSPDYMLPREPINVHVTFAVSPTKYR